MYDKYHYKNKPAYAPPAANRAPATLLGAANHPGKVR